MSSVPYEKGADASVEERAAFLSPPPRSGEFSPFAEKIILEALVWLCSIVVFATCADMSKSKASEGCRRCNCGGRCIASLVMGLLSFFLLSALLGRHILVACNKMNSSSWFSSAREKHLMMFLALWWAIIAAVASAYDDIESTFPVLAFVFSWAAFFGCVVGSYKAYHSEKEEMKGIAYTRQLNIQAAEDEEYANF